MSVDFAALAARLLSQSRQLLAEWFPQGRLFGNEFKVGDLGGSPGESLSINVETGRWSDFSTGEAGGDLISLYAAMHGIKQIEAVKALDTGAILDRVAAAPKAEPAKKRDNWTPVLPVPESAPYPTNDFYRRDPKGEWVKLSYIARWAYRNAEGAILGYAVRFEWYEGDDLKKDVVPQTFCVSDDGRKQWRWRSFGEPRPLYNLQELAARPGAHVIVLEGEKKVDALQKLAPQYVGVAWPGGAAAWQKVDWSPLDGRNVLLWPDADKQVAKNKSQAEKFKVEIGERIPMDSQPGMRAMWEIGHHLFKKCPTVKVIIPDDESLPDGWDCADAVRDGWDWERFKAWALPRVQLLREEGSHHEQSNQGSYRASSKKQRSESVAAGNAGGGREQAESGSGPQGADSADRNASRGDQLRGQASGADGKSVAADAPAALDQEQARHRGSAERNESAGRILETDGGASATDRGPASRPAGNDQRDAGDGQRHENAIDRDREDRGDPQPAAGLQRTDGLLPKAGGSASSVSEVQAGQALSIVGKWVAWDLERNGRGLPVTNLNNAVKIMTHDPNLRGVVWFDEFKNAILTGDGREWSETDYRELRLYMQDKLGISRMGKEDVSDAVEIIARRDTRNCVKDWIATLPAWDGESRIDGFLTRVFGCDDNTYTRSASRNFWISMLARVYQPGCKVDTMIVLEGGQGAFKSTALSAIADPWFAEQHESAQNSKAFAEVLHGQLLVEIAEMDAFGRAEVNTIKKIVSCQSDRYRPAYGRLAQSFPRQGVMAGSTNKDDWNKDETGARRFWPIACKGQADIAYVREVRGQCFREALALFEAGASWWEMPDAETKAEQRKRYDADPWIGPISEWLLGRATTTVMDVATGCLDLPVKDVDRMRQMRIAACLRVLGWVNQGNKKIGGKVVKLWTAPGDLYAGSDLSKGSDLSGNEVKNPSDSVGNTGSDLQKGSDQEQKVATLQNDIPFQ